MIYTITTSGLYYIRVDLYSSIPTAYSFTIKVNGVTQSLSYDTVLSYTTARTVQQVVTQNACRAQFTYTGMICNLYLFAPGANVVTGTAYASNTSAVNPKVMLVDLNVGGTWSFVINHGLTSGVTSLSPFTLDIKTFTESECINFCTGKPYSNGLAGGTNNICLCVTGFYWNSGAAQCYVNCTLISMATTIVSGTNNQCNCQTGYSWDTTTGSCRVPCPSIANAISLVTGTINTCTC